MGRMYTVSFTEVAVTAVQDLFQLEAKTSVAIVHGIFISQTTDVGDAEAENLSIVLARVTDAVSNVTVETVLNTGDAAANANLNVNQTTQLVTGAATVHSEAWNIALPFVWMPPPEMRIIIRPDDAFVVDLNTAPGDSLTMSGTLYFEEIG